MIQMKKKLFALVLSVVMLVSLLVPVLVSSAEETYDAKIGLGEVAIQELQGVKYLTIPVLIENNTEIVGLRYYVTSEENVTPFNFRAGSFKEVITDPFGDEKTNSFGITPNTLENGFFVLHAASEDAYGITTKEGVVGTAYFNLPTEIGTYNFTIEVGDASHYTRDEAGNPTAGTAVVGYTTQKVSYTVECTSHNPGDAEETKAPTCDEKGEEVVKCTACEKVLDTNEVAALGHDMVADEENSKAPTCDEKGVKATKCNREGCDHTEEEEIAALGHKEGEAEETKAPTCTEKGEKTVKCTVCEEVIDTIDVAALGHKWDAGTVAEGVKCGETADTTHKCLNDGCDATDVREGAVVEHDMVADEENSKAPTCTEKGVEATKCNREGCDHTEEEEVAALGHTEGEYEVVLKPTSEAMGKKEARCTVCGEVAATEDIAKLEKVVEGEMFIFESEEANLPDDIGLFADEENVEEADGKITVPFVFYSEYVDLEGEVKVSIDTKMFEAEGFKNLKVYAVNEAGEKVLISEIKDGILTFDADLAGEYILEAEEVKTSPETGDASNVVVFAVVALMAVAALVVVGKKRFAL